MTQNSGEGLDYFTKAAGLVMLRYMAGNRRNLSEMLCIIREASDYFGKTMENILGGEETASLQELMDLGVMKKKYLPYSSYMATISAYPLLRKKATRAQILSTVLAKMALILSIKVLDNINDTFHTTEEAEQSLQRQKKAIEEGAYTSAGNNDIIKRAENSCILLALLVNKWLKSLADRVSTAKKEFLRDLSLYIFGQGATFKQQSSLDREKLTIHDYLRNMNEKGVGRVWVGLDLCMLESLCEKTQEEIKGFEYLRKGFDYVFKSSNYYDDVADLSVDIGLGIWNSVVYLGRDLGIITKPEESLNNNFLKRQTIRLGDLHFLRGVDLLRQASKYVEFDEKSLIASMNVFRFFTVRKWFFQSKNPADFVDFLVARVPDTLMRYAHII
ncbi:MAG: hypothetical protein QXN23_04630 [Candidatus Caldarchaeum sp.]|uniref:Uncharacterized protein n=1 Tax=Caldiarchaeum subterraneum TaxID=311458 RepID=A0A7C4DZA4_CALS0